MAKSPAGPKGSRGSPPQAETDRVRSADLRAVDSDVQDDGRGFAARLNAAIQGRSFRDRTRFTAVALAAEVGLKPQTISRYMRGTKQPFPHTVYALAKALRCLPGWLVFGGAYGRPDSPEATPGQGADYYGDELPPVQRPYNGKHAKPRVKKARTTKRK